MRAGNPRQVYYTIHIRDNEKKVKKKRKYIVINSSPWELAKSAATIRNTSATPETNNKDLVNEENEPINVYAPLDNSDEFELLPLYIKIFYKYYIYTTLKKIENIKIIIAGLHKFVYKILNDFATCL